MLTAVLAHLASLMAGYLASAVVYLVTTPINLLIGAAIISTFSGFLLERGVALEAVEELTAKTISSFFFMAGILEGIAKIIVALLVFKWFGARMGWIMVVLFAAFQLVPVPAALGERNRTNMRAGSWGAILGLVGAWLSLSLTHAA